MGIIDSEDTQTQGALQLAPLQWQCWEKIQVDLLNVPSSHPWAERGRLMDNPQLTFLLPHAIIICSQQEREWKAGRERERLRERDQERARRERCRSHKQPCERECSRSNSDLRKFISLPGEKPWSWMNSCSNTESTGTFNHPNQWCAYLWHR